MKCWLNNLFKKQYIYKEDWNHIKKHWIEILVNWYLKKELINIFNIDTPNIIKEKKINFDKKVIDILYQNKTKLIKIFEKDKVEHVNINMFPETLAYFYSNKDEWEVYINKIKKLSEEYKSINSKNNLIIELLENWSESKNIINSDYINKLMYIKNQIKTLYYLDDVSSKFLNKCGSYYIEYLYKYIAREKFINWLKIDINLFKWVIEDNENSNYFINLLKEKNIKEIVVVFEWVEDIEEYQKLVKLKRMVEERIWIKLYMQWFLFHRPKPINT